MSTFAKYLTESTKTYEYKVKVAGDIAKDFATRLETACKKFEVTKLSAGKKTPIQSLPLDFPALSNESVTIYDLTTAVHTQCSSVAQGYRSETGYGTWLNEFSIYFSVPQD